MFVARSRFIFARSSFDTRSKRCRLRIQHFLKNALRDGLPLSASAETLEALSKWAYNSTWQPKWNVFRFPRATFAPIEYSTTNTKNTESEFSRELLVTHGPLLVGGVSAGDGAQLWRTPSLYKSVAANALPLSLKMDRYVAGFVRQPGGTWRQVVRVFYAPPESGRNDRERAETLCGYFLRTWCLLDAQLGLANNYAPMASQRCGFRAKVLPGPPPKPAPPGAPEPGSIRLPGDVILFRSGEARSEAEWLREIMHEYSHVALAAICRFLAACGAIRQR
jgi:hypothetical protein